MIKKDFKTLLTYLLIALSVLSIFYFFTNTETMAKKDDDKPKTTTKKTITNLPPGEIELNKILTNGKPTVIYFGSSFCKDCQQVKPVVEKLQKSHEEEIDFLIVDVRDKDPLSKAAIKKFRVLGVPLTVFVKKDGSKQTVFAGFYPESNFEEQIEIILKK